MKYLYILVAIAELFFVISLFFCRGGLGSGITCQAGIFSAFLQLIQEIYVLSVLLFFTPWILLGAILITAFIQLVRSYRRFQREDLSVTGALVSFFGQNPQLIYNVVFLVIQIPLFLFGWLAFDIQEKERMERVGKVQYQAEKEKAKEEELREQERVYADTPFLERAINRLVSGRDDASLLNNSVVVSNLVNEFVFQNKRLPLNASELQALDPSISLPFEYVNESDRTIGKGSINGILYQKRSAETYDLCADFAANPLPYPQSYKTYNSATHCIEIALEQSLLDHMYGVVQEMSTSSQFNWIEWTNQVESRFSEYVSTNNVLVLNDVTERFHEKNGRLPKDPTEFTDLVPSLKPRYKTEGEKIQNIGWIYGVFYRQKSERAYELCLESKESPEDLPTLGIWEFKFPYYCLQRTI